MAPHCETDPSLATKRIAFIFSLFLSCTGSVLGPAVGLTSGPGIGAGAVDPRPAQPEPQVGGEGFTFGGNAQLGPRLRLKSNAEIYASIQDTFGVTPRNMKALPAEAVDKVTGFSNNSNAHRVGQELFLALDALATEVASKIADAALRKGCVGPNATGLNCAKTLIALRGPTLLAREVSAEEVEAMSQVFVAVAAKGTEDQALRAVVEAMVQLPSFMYRTESGIAGIQETSHPLSSSEVAAALASLLWDAPADAALLDAVKNDSLTTAEAVEKQARRMLSDPKARTAFGHFALQWLDIRDLESIPRDPKAFPAYGPPVAKSMLQETTRFAAASVFDKDSTLKTLLSGKSTVVDQTLSQFYGFGQVTGAAFKEVTLPSFKAGILSQGSFMLAHSGEAEVSPVKTGTFVRTRLLCNVIPPPPPTAPTKVDPPTGGQTIQDVFNQNRLAGCKGCHQLTNPIGFGFANLDAVGKSRTQFNNAEIDSSGTILSADLTKTLSFSAGTGVYEALATMPETSDCFVLRLYQFALGRAAGNQDKPTLDALAKQFQTSKPRIDELLVSIVTSPDFLARKTN